MNSIYTKIGIDILSTKRFAKSLKQGGDTFLQRVFTPQELRQNSKEQLASIFCLKEAVIKALELSPGDWLLISTNRKQNGKIDCSLLSSTFSKRITSIDSSISHDRELIVGVAVIMLQ